MSVELSDMFSADFALAAARDKYPDDLRDLLISGRIVVYRCRQNMLLVNRPVNNTSHDETHASKNTPSFDLIAVNDEGFMTVDRLDRNLKDAKRPVNTLNDYDIIAMYGMPPMTAGLRYILDHIEDGNFRSYKIWDVDQWRRETGKRRGDEGQ